MRRLLPRIDKSLFRFLGSKHGFDVDHAPKPVEGELEALPCLWM
jgi:hypothetical protein